MMFSPSQQWIVVGIAAASYGCALANYSAIFTRVTYYLDWIYSMNVSDAITVDTTTTTATVTSITIASTTTNTITIMTTIVNNTSNSSSNNLPCPQHHSTLFSAVSIIFLYILLFK